MVVDNDFYDVVIIGGGPSGLTASIYLARACYRVLVVEKEKFGGQITITSEIVNYPGVMHASGESLTSQMKKQAEAFGAEFMLAEATKLDMGGDIKHVYTSRGILNCHSVLLATGAHPRQIGFKGEEEFKGHGVAYCATCDGEFFRGKEVFVVGGGFAAAEESVFLTQYARHVTILVREEDFTCAKAVADKPRSNPKITILTDTEVEEVSGDTLLRSIKYRNTKTGEVTEYNAYQNETFGVFVFAGYAPATELIADMAELDEMGYVITDAAKRTTVPGLYAAGDVCQKNLRQVVTAVGDGATAATEIERYVTRQQEKTGVKAEFKQNPRHTEEKGNVSEKVQINSEHGGGADAGKIFGDDMRSQLDAVLSRLERKLCLKLYLDDKPVSHELKSYITELTGLSDKLFMEEEKDITGVETPCVKVCYEDGSESGLAFHGVPGGHEFTSFILGLYNAAGPGQELDEDLRQEIENIGTETDIRIMVSLSCTMCPELVTAAQRIASLNCKVKAEVYDINHFESLKEKYQVMSVPCMVINDSAPMFGKKNIKDILRHISDIR